MLDATDTLLSRELAGYRLTHVLGHGGMSTVYLGRRLDDLHMKSAIKVLRDSPATTGNYAAFRARFYREAETAASLWHEHILPVLDYGEWQGLPYMVMPLATGGTLRRRVASESGPFPFAITAAYAAQLASALDYAHQHGIVHCDVKPSNVLLDGQGRLLLADFGIAYLYGPSSGHADVPTILTRDGEVIGTPSYMAPEQFKGQRVGPAADIYALGVMLYLLTAGRLPFAGATPVAVGMAHLRETPLSPCLYRPDLPGPAAAAILSALAKDPRRRFESAGALALAFAAGVEDSWTAANSEHANMLDRELTQPYPVRSWRARPRTATGPSLRVGLATIAAAMLLGGGIVAAQAIQSESIPSLAERPAFHSVAINASAPEQTANVVANSHPTKSNPTGSTPASSHPPGGKPKGQQPLTTLISYRGSQVYAQRSDGKRLWTVWTDGVLTAPPRIRGDIIYLTTLIGSQYTLRAGDGEILSLVTAAMQQDNRHGDGHGDAHDRGNHHRGHHGSDHGNHQGDNSNSD
ncbi:MAG TPA: serine/threonine-protein kinase [Ktedonobacterales bacterium]|jgi:serine/threonine-protein kinase